MAAIYYQLGQTGTPIRYKEPFIISQEGLTDLSYYAVDQNNNQETPKTVQIKLIKPWVAHQTVLCEKLKAVGHVDIDSIYCNGAVSLMGDFMAQHLWTSERMIYSKGHIRIKVIQKNLPAKIIPKPDWDGLTKKTQLKKINRITGGYHQNIRVENDLVITGNPQMSGLLVVKGNLTIIGKPHFKNIGIFCTGKITIISDTKIEGLIYAGKGLKLSKHFHIHGVLVVKDEFEITGSKGNIHFKPTEYEKWLRKIDEN